MKSNLLQLFFAFLLIMLVPVLSFAQASPGDEGICDNPDNCPVPIDGWLVVLLVAGVLYGTHKYLKRSNKPVSGNQ